MDPPTGRRDFLVGEQKPIDVSPLFLICLPPSGVLPGLQLLLLVSGDITGRHHVYDLATHDRHFVLGELLRIVEDLLASLAVCLVVSPIKVLPKCELAWLVDTHTSV
jgi:hypothetical protein